MTGHEQSKQSAYASAGVDYATLDAGKRLALTEALKTSAALSAHGGRALDQSRGEPAFVFELGDRTLAFVMEGLGTKAMIARQVAEQSNVNRFDAVAYDTVAAIVNDLCCVGALPLVVNAYFATGSSDWYRSTDWNEALIKGWSRACADCDATWGGGESPSLPGLVDAKEIELAGSAVGAMPEGRGPILGDDLSPGDEIVLVASSGLHANGASLARMVADRLPDGYATELPSGRGFGEALLDPSILYARLVGALAQADVPVRYYSHVTGHGLLKLMRPPHELTYRIVALPPVPEVLTFLAEQSDMDAHSAYSTLNMGSGYAVYTRPGTGQRVVEIAEGLGHHAILAGQVEDGPRQVIVEPIDVVYATDELDLAPQDGPPQPGQ